MGGSEDGPQARRRDRTGARGGPRAGAAPARCPQGTARGGRAPARAKPRAPRPRRGRLTGARPPDPEGAGESAGMAGAPHAAHAMPVPAPPQRSEAQAGAGIAGAISMGRDSQPDIAQRQMTAR